MKIDRHERFVLKVLELKYGISLHRLLSMFEMKRATVVYDFVPPFYVTAKLVTPTNVYYNEASANNDKHNVERIGRMLVFARCVLDYYNDMTNNLWELSLSGSELEKLVREEGYSLIKTNDERKNGN